LAGGIVLMKGYYWDKFKRELICIVKWFYSTIYAWQGPKETIFVVGAQRSGTNLLMDMLERNMQIDVLHERDSRAFDNYIMRPTSVITALREKSKFRFFAIKGLCESHKTHELLDTFRPAKAIWVIRDYNDVVNSMDISFKETRDIIKQVRYDISAGGWRTEGMSDETYEIVKALIHDDMSNKSASALQWYMRNIVFFENCYFRNKDIYLLNYNDLVIKPEKTLRDVCSFSGVSYNPIMCSMVNNMSVRKNRKPDIDVEIREKCDELWQRFEGILIG